MTCLQMYSLAPFSVVGIFKHPDSFLVQHSKNPTCIAAKRWGNQAQPPNAQPFSILHTMSQKNIISTEAAPAAIGPYSQAVKAGDFLFCSGQLGLDPATGKMVEGGVEAQARQIFKNIDAVLAAANLDKSHIVKASVYLMDLNDFKQVNTLYAEYLPVEPPARTTLQVAGLPMGARVEIEIIAHSG